MSGIRDDVGIRNVISTVDRRIRAVGERSRRDELPCRRADGHSPGVGHCSRLVSERSGPDGGRPGGSAGAADQSADAWKMSMGPSRLSTRAARLSGTAWGLSAAARWWSDRARTQTAGPRGLSTRLRYIWMRLARVVTDPCWASIDGDGLATGIRSISPGPRSMSPGTWGLSGGAEDGGWASGGCRREGQQGRLLVQAGWSARPARLWGRLRDFLRVEACREDVV